MRYRFRFLLLLLLLVILLLLLFPLVLVTAEANVQRSTFNAQHPMQRKRNLARDAVDDIRRHGAVRRGKLHFL